MSMKKEFFAKEDVVSNADDDLVLDDEDHHSSLMGNREARDLMKAARVVSIGSQ